MDDCPICAKHRGAGPLKGALVGRWDGFRVYHSPPGDDGKAALGYLFIESERHAPHLEDLTHQEASALGLLRSRLALALTKALDTENVFAAVIGRGVPHFLSTSSSGTGARRTPCPGTTAPTRRPARTSRPCGTSSSGCVRAFRMGSPANDKGA